MHHNSYRIASYIRASLESGISVTIASEGKYSLISEVAAGIHIDFSDYRRSLTLIETADQKHAFTGVIGCDDETVELAALVAKTFDLPHNPPIAARYSRRKDLARKKLAESGCAIPRHSVLDLTNGLDKILNPLDWPTVLKPLNMSGSRGVTRVDDHDSFIAAILRLKKILAEASDPYEKNHLLLEEYIDGIEIAYEGYLIGGRLHTITIFDKPEPLTGPYFAETIYVTPTALDRQLRQQINDVIQQACDAYGLVTGVIHAECRIDANNRVWILEVASRTIGGDCARILDYEDFNMEQLAIRLAIGETVELKRSEQSRGVMMIPVKKAGLLRRVEGLSQARKTEFIDKVDIIINSGHELKPLPDDSHYLGYIFASAGSRQQVIDAINTAYAHLKFITAPVYKIEGTVA